MGRGLGISCWRQLRNWQAITFCATLHRALLGRLEGSANWNGVGPRSTARAKQPIGDQSDGPEPNQPRKASTKRHLVVNARGTLLGAVLT